MKLVSLVVSISLMLGANALAQAPAAAAESKAAAPAAATPSRIGILDFNRAVVESSEGKKAAEAIKGEMSKKEAEFNKAQSDLEALQKQASGTSAAVLSDTFKADLARKIDSAQTNLTRINEDAQKEMSTLQEKHFGPIAQIVSKEVNTYATEQGLALVLDGSMQPNNILFASDVADITTEIIRRVDAAAARTSTAPAAAPKAAAPANAAPRTITPAPAAPKTATPAAPK